MATGFELEQRGRRTSYVKSWISQTATFVFRLIAPLGLCLPTLGCLSACQRLSAQTQPEYDTVDDRVESYESPMIGWARSLSRASLGRCVEKRVLAFEIVDCDIDAYLFESKIQSLRRRSSDSMPAIWNECSCTNGERCRSDHHADWRGPSRSICK